MLPVSLACSTVGKRKNKRGNAKMKRAGTGESAGGFLFFFFPVRASLSLSSFSFSPLSLLGSFFVGKIDAIHAKLDRLADCLHDSHFDYVKTSPTRTLDSFIPLTESAVSKLIGCSPKKSCMFDPMSTPMVISCANGLLPVITKMINLSLNSGEFADDWKCGFINPILKKPGLDLLYKNYRPVCNLQ